MAEPFDPSRPLVIRPIPEVARAERSYGEGRLLDVYRPREASGPRPAVFFLHGGPIPPSESPKDWGLFRGYGALAAAQGFVAVVVNHRLHAPTDYGRAEGDVIAAVDHVRTNARELGVDPDRLALWAFSGGGPLLTWALREPRPYVRCLLGFYALLDVRGFAPPNADDAMKTLLAGLSPAANVRPKLPTFIARAGRDAPMINVNLDGFVAAALAANAELTLVNHAEGQHTFDVLDDVERSREIIAAAFAFLRANLG